jgi:chemotaxis protein CheX
MTPPSAIQIDEEYMANHIATAVKSIFSTMLAINDLQSDAPLQEKVSKFKCSISGMVGLGGGCSGIVAVHISEDMAKEVTAAMMSIPLEEVTINPDAYDAIGEITNMLGGEIKLALSKGGGNINLSTPSIISGDEYCIDVLSSGRAVIVPFSRGKDHFLASVQIEEK